MEVYTPAEVAKMLKISKSHAYDLFNSAITGERIPGFKIGKNWRVERSQFEAWVAQKSQQK